MPIVSRKEGTNTRKGRKAFFRAYFLPASDRSVCNGALPLCSGAIVAVLMLGRLSQGIEIKPHPGSQPTLDGARRSRAGTSPLAFSRSNQRTVCVSASEV